MVLTIVVWLVGVLCVLVVARRWRQMLARAGEIRAAAELGRPSRARLLAVLPEQSEPGELARAVLDAPSRAAAVALLNEALGDVKRELEVGADVPRSATRVCLASGGLAGLLELARALPVEVSAGLPWAGAAFAGGLVGAAMCLQLGRMAEERARACRDGYNGLSRALGRLLDEAEDAGEPGRSPDLGSPGSGH